MRLDYLRDYVDNKNPLSVEPSSYMSLPPNSLLPLLVGYKGSGGFPQSCPCGVEMSIVCPLEFFSQQFPPYFANHKGFRGKGLPAVQLEGTGSACAG